MSARTRRRARQIARLIALDRNHSRIYLMTSKHRDGPRAARLWWSCIVPLGDKLERQKAGAWHALPRCSTGDDILMMRYRERTGRP
jgi:hypothetical protein